SLCSGCGICVKKCPFHCFQIVNLPDMFGKEITHRYAPDGFALFRMLMPKKGKVLGIIGQNGIGKSTAMKILAGEFKMNLGMFEENGDEIPDWDKIIKFFRGSELQSFLTDLMNKTGKLIYKPQNITDIPKHVKGKVGETLKKIDELESFDWVVKSLGLDKLLDRKVSVLSGGELQRFTIAATIMRDGVCYLFDEPSSYLDVKERLKMAGLIRSLAAKGKTILIVEHDLAILDYLSDYVSLLYGKPGAYGIISHPHGVRVGINVYLGGYIKDENMRFRPEPIVFHTRPPIETLFNTGNVQFEYPDMVKTLGNFKLTIYGGEIHSGEVIGILGPNGIGKTTFINLIAKKIKPDYGEIETGKLEVALKPQYIEADENKNVDDILMRIRTNPDFESQYKRRLIETLELESIKGRNLRELSGGELQRVTIAECLTTTADIYLLDEPSAFLDVEMRLRVAVLIRKSIEEIKKSAFVVEHDIITQDFISDSLIVFEGTSGVNGNSTPPQELRSGMNTFLANMDITFRRDPTTGRPRVNKKGSNLDSYQKSIGEFYYVPKKGEE
ncbi:MAG: ribosome biogenesis/translation initiation ATPase RLI, partial [archaeon]|nr:ribosome biogenesis/translation initiation ATPase RLI [archaeon]